jgi:hypothetical protein
VSGLDFGDDAEDDDDVDETAADEGMGGDESRKEGEVGAFMRSARVARPQADETGDAKRDFASEASGAAPLPRDAQKTQQQEQQQEQHRQSLPRHRRGGVARARYLGVGGQLVRGCAVDLGPACCATSGLCAAPLPAAAGTGSPSASGVSAGATAAVSGGGSDGGRLGGCGKAPLVRVRRLVCRNCGQVRGSARMRQKKRYKTWTHESTGLIVGPFGLT